MQSSETKAGGWLAEVRHHRRQKTWRWLMGKRIWSSMKRCSRCVWLQTKILHNVSLFLYV